MYKIKHSCARLDTTTGKTPGHAPHPPKGHPMTQHIAAIIPADEDQPIRIEHTTADLAALQDICAGIIEAVGNFDVTMYLHEEGKLIGLAPNPRATAFAIEHGMIHWRDHIAGNAVLLGFNPETGEHNDLPRPALEHLTTNENTTLNLHLTT